ncbi:hypothetical protein [Halobaculum litoreum]|uniref:DUF8173 domain-containing protein n=1 Tax=Halobaculum litoreum TaxID=3031998 RepID=A0ABD5XPT9_9EURY|nr:hypothetical protein [Halobaculum sp. DT92]
MPSTRTLVGAAGAAVALAAVAVGSAAAQSGVRDPATGLDAGAAVLLDFGVGLVVYLLLGGVLVAVKPAYATAKVREFRDDPGETVVWGLITGIGVPIVLVLIGLTVIGLLIAIPGMFVLAAMGILGTAVVVVVVGTAVTRDGGEPGGTEVLVGALVFAALTALPLVGGLINSLATLPGLGMVGRDLNRAWDGD